MPALLLVKKRSTASSHNSLREFSDTPSSASARWLGHTLFYLTHLLSFLGLPLPVLTSGPAFFPVTFWPLGILVPPPGIRPATPAAESQASSPLHHQGSPWPSTFLIIVLESGFLQGTEVGGAVTHVKGQVPPPSRPGAEVPSYPKGSMILT